MRVAIREGLEFGRGAKFTMWLLRTCDREFGTAHDLEQRVAGLPAESRIPRRIAIWTTCVVDPRDDPEDAGVASAIVRWRKAVSRF